MKEFVMKLLNILVIAAILFGYQNDAIRRQQEVRAYEQEKKEAEQAWKEAELIRQKRDNDVQNVSEASEKKEYQDGVFEGSGTGFGGQIVVQIKIQDDSIVDAGITAADNETPDYLKAASVIIEELIEEGSTEVDVDTVSGATLSSNGILEAVNHALKEAKNE